MVGSSIFKFTATEVVHFIKDQNLPLEEMISIFHQANSFMLDYMRQKLNIPENKFLISMKDFGNTVSTSIPLAIFKNTEMLLSNDLFLCGFGIGASYSSIQLLKQIS